MKTTVSSQKQRLETALSTERLWTPTAWRELFVGNPIMHQFAIQTSGFLLLWCETIHCPVQLFDGLCNLIVLHAV